MRPPRFWPACLLLIGCCTATPAQAPAEKPPPSAERQALANEAQKWFREMTAHHKAGKLRIITTMAEEREKVLPDIPTARESGYDLIAGTYNLLAAPLGTPAELLEPIARALTRVMDRPAIQEKLVQLGITPVTRSDPAKARAYVASEVARWTPIVKKLRIAL